MGTTERRQREKENLRRAILDAARELFATQDYKAVSMRKIADRIEYSPTAIYLHFKDKEAILAELINEGFGLLCGQICPLAREQPDPVERLRIGAREYYRFAWEHPHYYRLMFQLDDAKRNMDLMPHCEAALQSFGFIHQCVREAQESGRFRTDTEDIVLSHAIWAAIHGAVSLVLSGHVPGILPPDRRDAFLDQVVEMTLLGSAPCP